MDQFVSVKHTQVNKVHFFTANDDYSDGLCVAHSDLKTALSETKVQLEKLLKLNHGIECSLEEAFAIEDIEAYIDRPLVKHVRTRYTSELDYRGVEQRRAA